MIRGSCFPVYPFQQQHCLSECFRRIGRRLGERVRKYFGISALAAAAPVCDERASVRFETVFSAQDVCVHLKQSQRLCEVLYANQMTKIESAWPTEAVVANHRTHPHAHAMRTSTIKNPMKKREKTQCTLGQKDKSIGKLLLLFLAVLLNLLNECRKITRVALAALAAAAAAAAPPDARSFAPPRPHRRPIALAPPRVVR